MPVDPQISLGVQPPQPPANPLATVASFAQIQNALNQNKLFQQEFMAKQKAGELIANTPQKTDGSPDFDAMTNNLYSDPDVAPFAGAIANSFRQLELANTQISGEKQKQNDTALGAIFRASAAAARDPTQLGPALTSALQGVPPDIRSRIMPAVGTWAQSLTANLPSDPEQAKRVYMQRLVAKQLAMGVSPEVLNGLTGSPTTRDQGGAIVSGTQEPAAYGGGFTPANALPKTLAPKDVEVTDPNTGRPGRVIIGGGGMASSGTQPGMPDVGAGPGLGLGGPPGAPPSPSLGGPAMAQPIPGTVGASPADLDINKQGAAYTDKINNDSRTALQLNKLVGFAREAEKTFTPGGGADVKDKLAQLGQAFGVPQEYLDKLVNGSQAGKQEFDNELNSAVFSIARGLVPEGSRFAVSEYEGISKSKPSANFDPRAVDKIFSQWTQLANQTLDEQKSWNQYQQQGGNYRYWPQQWNDISQKKGYVDLNPAERVGNAQEYGSLSDLQSAYKAGKITKAAAAQLAIQKGWASSGGQ